MSLPEAVLVRGALIAIFAVLLCGGGVELSCAVAEVRMRLEKSRIEIAVRFKALLFLCTTTTSRRTAGGSGRQGSPL